MDFNNVKKLLKNYRLINLALMNLRRKRLGRNEIKLKKHLLIVKDVLDASMEELKLNEYEILRSFFIENNNKYFILCDQYISEASFYRTINKCAMIVYKNVCKVDNLKKSFLYVINYLQI